MIQRSKVLMLLFFAMLPCSLATASTFDDDVKNKLDHQLARNALRYGLISQSVLVLKNGKPFYQGINGQANLELNVSIQNDSVYPVYSLAKLFASVVLMKLVESREIDLDRSIGEYLPELPKSWHLITLRQCLNHASGLPEYFSLNLIKNGFLKNKSQVFESLASESFQFTTAQSVKYNNTNYLIISAIIEKQTKRQYSELVNEIIISPLKLLDTGYAGAREVRPKMVTSYSGNEETYLIDRGVDWPEYTFVHSGLYSTANDLSKFMTAVVQGKILSKNTVEKMWRPFVLVGGASGRYASGWEYSADDKFTQVSHEGGNRVRLSHFYSTNGDEDNYTIVYLTNGNRLNTWTSILVDSVVSKIDPESFPFAFASSVLIDKAINGKSIEELDTLFTSISRNQYVKNYGLEKFIRVRAYGILHSKGKEYSHPLFDLKRRKFSDVHAK